MSKPSQPKNLAKYNQAFSEELARLNTGQQEAVEQIEGPVLVIAGPGTGKTHILTARIGRILMETDAQAANILCLTFTDAGVHAMRERLLEFIGPEAHRVHIYTFHSFCNSIIQDNLERFGRHELEPLNDLERVELIRKLIDDLPPDHLLKSRSNDLYFYERHLYDLFKRMKSEAWSGDFINEKIDEYLSDLPNREDFIYKRKQNEFKKGDLKTWKIEEQIDRMDLLRAAVDLYPNYIHLMDRARRYDFDDMILWVLKAFEEHEALLRTYQEKYLYFLVDEYQDTNGSQNQVLHKLIEYWNSPNVFIVGDDDQSIFEFQGARLKNLVDFYNDYKKDLKLVMLKDNYRSSQHILDSSRAVIDHNQNRIVSALEGIDKNLKAQNKLFARSPIKPHIVEYQNRAQEEADLVLQIETLYAEGFPLEDTAIIYAKHRQVRNIITLLEKKGIPYNTRRQVNILDLPLVINLRLFLEYINAEHYRPYSGEPMLYKIMHFSFLGILTTDLAKLSFHLAKQEKGSSKHWRDLISDEEKLVELGVKGSSSILRFAELINHLIGDYANFTLPTLVERISNRSGLLAQLLKRSDKNWQLQVLSTFCNFIRKETDKNPRLTLKNLLDIFGNMDTNYLSIGIQKTIHAKHGVNLLTAHSSKGLEFQYAFMLDCVKDQWEPGKSRGARRFTFPDTLTFSGEDDAMEARRRLFYVAMTRAKEFLHISYSAKDNAGKSLQRALYIDEILDDTEIKIQQKEPDENTLIDAQMLLLLETEKPVAPKADKDEINAILEGFALSVTSLNSFLRCPLSFYYENVLRIPYVQSEAASYGIAMHFAISKIFEKRQIDPEFKLPSADDMVIYFKSEMHRQRGQFTKKEFSRRLEMGERELSAYYQQYVYTWPKKLLIEHNIRNVEIDGVPIIGTIDRLDFNKENNYVHVLDYKTGRPNDSRFRKFTDANPNGGNYRRQLIFYKLLYEAHQVEKIATSGEISYLESNSKGEFKSKRIEFVPKEVEIVRGLIKDAYRKILAHDFYEGCGEKNCKWCNFVKYNVMVDSFVDLEGEELDD